LRKQKVTIKSFVIMIISVLLALVMLLPVVWALFCSLQQEGKQITTIWDWFLPPYTLMNYPDVLMGTSTLRWFINSLAVAVISTVLSVIISTMAAYAIAKIPFKGSKWVYTFFLFGLLVPGEATIIPMFILVHNLNLINTFSGLVLPSIAGSMNLLIAVSFFRGIPTALMEAVRIDGGSELTIYRKIALPLSKPIIATISIMCFIGSWNNYLWPLLCIFDEAKYTLPIGIPTLLSVERPDVVIPMTVNMVASIPMIIVYLIFEKQIVQGISMEGIKG